MSKTKRERNFISELSRKNTTFAPQKKMMYQ